MDNEDDSSASPSADIVPNTTRDPQGQNNITKFSVGRIEKFLKTNSISMILRSH
jgi:hypothetical protein